MNLNEQQKGFLDKLNLPLDSKDRLKDINTFFEVFGNIKENIRGFQWATPGNKTNELDFIDPKIFRVEYEYGSPTLTMFNPSIIFIDTMQTFHDTLYFIELIVELEKNKLIAFIDKEPNELKKFKVPVLEETKTVGAYEWHPPFYKLWILIKEFVLVEFIPMPELYDFIINDYKTKKEIEKENEEKYRKRSLKWTIFIAITSIILSISTGIFNYFTYQKDRVVSIQNQKDTVRVILLDTLKGNK
jgi:hypothetical protein